MALSLPDPEHGDKRATAEVVLRLAACDRARELVDPHDPRAAAAVARIREWARRQAEAHRYANSERRP